MVIPALLINTSTSTDADKKAEPFTEKVPEPKGDENPSKGNTTPESADKPYDTEVKPDMKADPSKAGKKFKITGLQLKAVKAKLKEGIEDEHSKKRLLELQQLKAEIHALSIDENELVKLKSTIEIEVIANQFVEL
jgi:hypothetical protein